MSVHIFAFRSPPLCAEIIKKALPPSAARTMKLMISYSKGTYFISHALSRTGTHPARDSCHRKESIKSN